MNDELFKEFGEGYYFEDFLVCIRDIRSSEKEFWRKVLTQHHKATIELFGFE